MSELTTLQKALLTIKKLKQQVKNQHEPIAIVGLSCRFPEVKNKKEYWQLLCAGKNVITSMPESRWQWLQGSKEMRLRNPAHSYWGGFLENIADFDAYFFGISPREAMRMDPQQRLLLEVSYEAIKDAGLSPDALAGSNTGVFTTLYASGFAHLQKLDDERDALYLPTGNALSIAANRLSYLLNLHGPSLVLDTACSSSLVAIHLAILSLQNKECDLALVGAANINLLPSINWVLAQAKMLSPDGQCKTFDAAANGYVQGEGIGAIVLKPLSKAREEGDRIYAVIMGSALNQDGKTNGLTAPNGLQQEALLKAAYLHAGIDPREIGYVECHGTGTFLGDPIEIQALGEVISQNRKENQPCWIGSVKTNLGHLEPAAGIASIIKVALALQHGKIPPHLNFKEPNPHIAFDKYHLLLPSELMAWPKYGDYRLAGISGFGFGGTNAHVVLREVSDEERKTDNLDEFYNWQHKTYWPLMHDESENTSNHPLLGKIISSPLSTLQIAFTIDLKKEPEFADTNYVLHVGYYLEMMAFIAQKHFQQTAFTLLDHQFLTPLFALKNKSVQVMVLLEKLTASTYSYSFYSTTQTNWVLHAQGKLDLATPTPCSLSIAKIKPTLPNTESAEKLYERIRAMGMPNGASIRWAHHYWWGENKILCEFKQPQTTLSKNNNYSLNLHPGIFDGAIQTLFKLFPADLTKPYIGAAIEKINFYGKKKESIYFYGQLKEIATAKVLSDGYLMDENNELMAELINISLTPLNTASSLADSKTPLTKLNWQNIPISERKQQVIDFLIHHIATIYAMPESDIRINDQLNFDSLMALILLQIMEEGLDTTYNVQAILAGPTINELADFVLANQAPLPVVNPWIAFRQKQSHAKYRLFCFPYGGGGASIYQRWHEHISTEIEVCPIQLPGRETRLQEKPIDNLAELVAALMENLVTELDLPFVFFGHSLGALIAFELTRSLRKKGLPQPTHLFASAFPDPRFPKKSLTKLIDDLAKKHIDLLALCDETLIHQLSEEQLQHLTMTFSQHGISDYGEHLLNKDIVKVLLPIFSSDMQLVKNYSYDDDQKLDIPITVFAGTKDSWVPYDDHLTWHEHTQQICEIHSFNSGHLFIKDEKIKQAILRTITEKMEKNT